MGIYIKGMKIPEHCGVCRFAVDGWCYAYGKPNIDALANDGRTNFCPLVPVPPHGDLIDRDAAAEKIWDDMRFPSNLANAQFFVNELREMPTIIPAEEA